MISPRAALSLLVLAALPAWAPLHAEPATVATAKPRYLQASTPLEEIPVYALPTSAQEAVGALDAEIERLYKYATTQPSGPVNRAFRTRIYLLDKRLRPLRLEFNATTWDELRTAVKTEWLGVQAALPLPAAAPVEKTPVAGIPVASATP